MKTCENPVVEEVRRVRKQISAEFGHDVKKYLAHLAEVEERMRASGHKFYEPPKDREK